MNRGGRDNLNTKMEGALNDFLDRAGRSWTWPMLTKRVTEIPLVAGVGFVLVGAGAGGIDERVTHLLGTPILYEDANLRKLRGRPVLVDFIDGYSNAIVNGGGSIGIPEQYTIETVSPDQKRLLFNRASDVNLLIDMTAHVLYDRITTGTDIPWYPEDETMIQAVMAATLRSENGVDSPSYQAAMQELTEMMGNDKIRHGASSTVNTVMGLDTSVFR